jgi:hypothetical protein
MRKVYEVEIVNRKIKKASHGNGDTLMRNCAK